MSTILRNVHYTLENQPDLKDISLACLQANWNLRNGFCCLIMYEMEIQVFYFALLYHLCLPVVSIY